MSNIAGTKFGATVSTPGLPCDRGIKGNILARGYHNFQSSNGVICCAYCGAYPNGAPKPTQLIPPHPHPDAEAYFATCIEVLNDHMKTHFDRPRALLMSTRTANILATSCYTVPGQEPIDVSKGGTVLGIAFELDDSLPDGAVQSTI